MHKVSLIILSHVMIMNESHRKQLIKTLLAIGTY